jgi:hypothetical protein
MYYINSYTLAGSVHINNKTVVLVPQRLRNALLMTGLTHEHFRITSTILDLCQKVTSLSYAPKLGLCSRSGL